MTYKGMLHPAKCNMSQIYIIVNEGQAEAVQKATDHP